MSQPVSPYEIEPPPARRIAISVVVAALGALAVLFAAILPAEYGIDPTGIGRALGLSTMNSPNSSGRTVQVVDVIGGNEQVREVTVPDPGEPVPLPNPAVHQDESHAPRSETLEIRLEPGERTEIKTVLAAGKALVYSWQVDRGGIYVDYHGHDPLAGEDFWVRYEELTNAPASHGSLVAPFEGEHGWFWQNHNDFPVAISLTVTGYYQDLIDYGLF